MEHKTFTENIFAAGNIKSRSWISFWKVRRDGSMEFPLLVKQFF